MQEIIFVLIYMCTRELFLERDFYLFHPDEFRKSIYFRKKGVFYMREALSNKILLLGVDGLDPRLTRKYVDEGKMPNVKKYIEHGACRKDLVMLGGHPTVTPPMWTTLATGCYSNVHGITCFSRKGEDIDAITYNIDSRLCKAEPLWNCFAEAGKKTLVWHWPGSSWPPTSDSPNLMVVDGTSPGAPNMSIAQTEGEFLVGASETITGVRYETASATQSDAACVITDLEDQLLSEAKAKGVNFYKGLTSMTSTDQRRPYIMSENEGHLAACNRPLDICKSEIKPATGWANDFVDAKEFTLLLSQGLIRRPSLILKNEDGVYDRVAIYKNKKEMKPIVVLKVGKLIGNIFDDSVKKDSIVTTIRNMELLEIAPDGSNLRMFVSAAMEINNDLVWHPKSLYKIVAENIGHPQPTSYIGNQDDQLINDCMLHSWDLSAKWQADSINFLIDNEDLDVVFSHFHAVDLQSHKIIRFMSDKDYNKYPVEVAQKWMEDVYVQCDNYLGEFLHRLDEGWTIFIFSDHAQVCSKYDPLFMGDINAINIGFMEDLGLTVMKKDEEGNRLREIDWGKTIAVAQRSNHIYLNLKGREKHGIVDPADQYEVEEDIMTRLYGYKHPKTGKRVVALALRNKDAVLLGMGGPECGDILYWNAEGYNLDHSDSLSTTLGESFTSVSPIFIGAGKGLKSGFYTDRIIREVDFVPTVAYLGGVRMPAQCEGAIVYQILENEF